EPSGELIGITARAQPNNSQTRRSAVKCLRNRSNAGLQGVAGERLREGAPSRSSAKRRSATNIQQHSELLELFLLPPKPEKAAEEIHVFEHREGRVEVLSQALRHVGDPRPGGAPVCEVAHVAAEHFDRS